MKLPEIFVSRKHRHKLMGGCTNAKVCIRFHKLTPPDSAISISRAMDDFLDYSNQLSSMIGKEDRKSNIFYAKGTILKVDHPFKLLVLPTCKFSTGLELES